MGRTSKAEAYYPSPLGCTFVRVPFELITTMRRKGMPIKWAVMLTILKFCGSDEDGNVWTSCARSEVCSILGITKEQARTAVSTLIKQGVITVLEPGHNGRATVYRLNMERYVNPSPTAPQPTPTIPESTPTDSHHPSQDERDGSKAHPYVNVGVGLQPTPNRIFEEDSCRYPSSVDSPSDRDSEGESEDAYAPAAFDCLDWEEELPGGQVSETPYFSDVKPLDLRSGEGMLDSARRRLANAH